MFATESAWKLPYCQNDDSIASGQSPTYMAMVRTGGRAPFIILRRVSRSMPRADHHVLGFSHLR